MPSPPSHWAILSNKKQWNLTSWLIRSHKGISHIDRTRAGCSCGLTNKTNQVLAIWSGRTWQQKCWIPFLCGACSTNLYAHENQQVEPIDLNFLGFLRSKQSHHNVFDLFWLHSAINLPTQTDVSFILKKWMNNKQKKHQCRISSQIHGAFHS